MAPQLVGTAACNACPAACLTTARLQPQASPPPSHHHCTSRTRTHPSGTTRSWGLAGGEGGGGGGGGADGQAESDRQRVLLVSNMRSMRMSQLL